MADQFKSPLRVYAGKNLAPKRDRSVMDDAENFAPSLQSSEEPLGQVDVLDVLPWGPGRIGKMLGGLSALTASDPAEAATVKKMLMGLYRGFSGGNATPLQGATGLTPVTKVFTSPQRAVAERYAAKRSAQTGEPPHVEMLMVDPFAGHKYGHATSGTGANPPIPTMARKLSLDDIVDRFQLYRHGGLVRMKACNEYAEGGTVTSPQLTGSFSLVGVPGSLSERLSSLLQSKLQEKRGPRSQELEVFLDQARDPFGLDYLYREATKPRYKSVKMADGGVAEGRSASGGPVTAAPQDSGYNSSVPSWDIFAEAE